MTKIRFIGDVHGKFSRYKDVIKDVPVSMQVGDMGVGFYRYDYIEDRRVMTNNPPYDAMSKGNHSFIRGNHDNPQICEKQKYWIPDGTYENSVFCIGGASSIDKHLRTEGMDWWPDEELNYNALDSINQKYLEDKPRYMMTHECPISISNILVDRKYGSPTDTPKVFEMMFEAHKPELWIFGHWHKSFDKTILGTRFICLNELEYIDLEIEDE